MRTIVWFREKDLRLSDHGPLRDAIARGEAILLFVLDPDVFAPANAQKHPHGTQFLLESLSSLAKNIEHKGGRLLIVPGKSVEIVPKLARQWRVDRVVAHRRVEPIAREQDRKVTHSLEVPFVLFEGEMLLPPGTLRSLSGKPYSVFTPFSRAFFQQLTTTSPLASPRSLPPLPLDLSVKTVPIPTCTALGLERNAQLQPGGEAAGRRRLRHFLENTVRDYHVGRDRMDLDGTSRLSAHLKFGTVSVATVWQETLRALKPTPAVRAFLNELVWREFTHSTLWDRPELLRQPFRPQFRDFPWRRDEPQWQAWTEGRTGYPIVDAAARQLLTEGFVHNRARMIAASFLTKHLLLAYRSGEAHYMKYLTDGDWAQNNAGWQWSAGCGCDAQPYFRVFNPMTQGKRYDPHGDYVRRFVPELEAMPAKFIHAPWTAPAKVLDEAAVKLGVDYPTPIVDHATARNRYLWTAKEHLRESQGPIANGPVT